jgi:hypothetical protein
MPSWTTYRIRVQIDDGRIIQGGTVNFGQSDGPIVEYFRPAAASPAKAAQQNDFDADFYSDWFDTDTDMTDGAENEEFKTHFGQNREFFQNCFNPLEIEVSSCENFLTFDIKLS